MTSASGQSRRSRGRLGAGSLTVSGCSTGSTMPRQLTKNSWRGRDAEIAHSRMEVRAITCAVWIACMAGVIRLKTIAPSRVPRVDEALTCCG